MFNFLASKHRQPPEYRPQEEDEEEGQLRTARSVIARATSVDTAKTELNAADLYVSLMLLQACHHGTTHRCEVQTAQGHFKRNCRSLQVRSVVLNHEKVIYCDV